MANLALNIKTSVLNKNGKRNEWFLIQRRKYKKTQIYNLSFCKIQPQSQNSFIHICHFFQHLKSLDLPLSNQGTRPRYLLMLMPWALELRMARVLKGDSHVDGRVAVSNSSHENFRHKNDGTWPMFRKNGTNNTNIKYMKWRVQAVWRIQWQFVRLVIDVTESDQ